MKRWGRRTVTPTSRRAAVAALALLLGCAGCTAGPGEPADPPAEGPAPPVGFQASVVVRGQSLHITYELVNTGDASLTVFNRVSSYSWSGTPSDDPAGVYVTGTGESGRVQIAKRVFPRPDTDKVSWAVTPRTGAVTVAPGASVREEFDVALPLQRHHPYGDDLGDGPVKLPDPVREVVFCLGVARTSELPAASAESTYPHDATVSGVQHLSCSEPVEIS
ncbi:MAG TPA: hypothetical protein VN408_33365 [Actinoplanes sp.]|nr:hypothetical protein [Actinoplanes sp.]